MVIAARSAAMILHELRFGFARAAVRKDGETDFWTIAGERGQSSFFPLTATMGMTIVILMIRSVYFGSGFYARSPAFCRSVAPVMLAIEHASPAPQETANAQGARNILT
ncbi:hypothetical protein G6L97_26990 (plasmid) [Agrobacterium tumefaciens]|uniref:hypothetical protein n=1 Tax=Agrobacterium tumefaciens TaxID=358 RepID=UPI001572DE37|nr:hypothetical protein [Agrobacterium tumefaciens]WCA73072.1 hypothetical protein G6L97_26990 [Agrobacterium tumefaciens]